ncbi:hypothetical protein NECAME_03219 [Necator americanus]|uniref:Uncharacterized protein n=1 Tax=Necator americanus TaxID=51031 RepID=W2T6S2_NECAM|nr:hypothetical protein NECAME_03219 [Necator americanus]ETN77319.1 hypothetical protein NECAME_03219 [Necator americanus]
MSEREKAFETARNLGDSGKVDEALEAISKFTSDPEVQYNLSEMETINTIITEKLTRKDGEWLSLYSESVYETFSRMSICARDEERQLVWNRLKRIPRLPVCITNSLYVQIVGIECVHLAKRDSSTCPS